MKKNISTLGDIGEHAMLRLISMWFEGGLGPGIALGMGDDCCALTGDKSGAPLVMTTDALIENVHFRRDWMTMRDLGARALAVNLSDIAAMGARPVAALIALSVPPSAAVRDLKDFYMGLRGMAQQSGCTLAGGDLTRAPQWCIAITVMGRPAVGRRIVARSDARPGMTLYVTGTPGESGAGRAALEAGARAPKLIARHWRPAPRIEEAAALAQACKRLAMLDVSDGLWNDAGNMARASDVGVEIEAAKLPVSKPMRSLGVRLGVDPREWTLFGGEDYELLFATDAKPEELAQAMKRAKITTPLHAVGRVVKKPGLRLIGKDGAEIKISDKTFAHFGNGGAK